MAPLTALAALAALCALALPAASGTQKDIRLEVVGTYSTGVFAQGGAEISAHDPATQRLFTVNAATSSIDIVSIQNAAQPTKVGSISLAGIGAQANSVAFSGGVLAAAVEASPKQLPGAVAFFDSNGTLLSVVTVCALPDMITWTPDGRFAVAACEGEPNDAYTDDPAGGIAIVDVAGDPSGVTQADVRIAGFAAFDGNVPAGVRVFGPNATASQDFEPEYIATSQDSTTAWVTLQENNALAIVDLLTATVTQVVPLGFKNHALTRNSLDASDRDGPAIRIGTWPVNGMYLPDAIASFRVGGARPFS